MGEPRPLVLWCDVPPALRSAEQEATQVPTLKGQPCAAAVWWEARGQWCRCRKVARLGRSLCSSHDRLAEEEE